MKKILLYNMLFLLYLGTGKAQDLPGGAASNQNLNELADVTNGGAVRAFDNRYEGIKGTPYVFDDWKQADIFLVNNTRIENIKLVLDIKDNVAYASLNDQALLLKTLQIEKIIFRESGRTFLNLQYHKIDELDSGFVEELVKGKNSFYAIRTKKFIKADFEGGYSADTRYDEYIDGNSQYFFKNENEEIVKIKLRKKSVYEMFSVSKAKIDEIIKKENLLLDNENDFVRLIAYRNSGLF